MKNTPLKRTGFVSRTPLGGGKVGLRKTRLKARGRRKEREADAEKIFRKAVLVRSLGFCAICERTSPTPEDPYSHLQAHHMVPRGRSGSDKRIHNPIAGAALCFVCHDETHRGLHPDFIKPISFLDNLDTA